jgi:hypothetical protein
MVRSPNIRHLQPEKNGFIGTISGIPRVRVPSMMILLGLMTTDALSSIHEEISPRSLLVTVALDRHRLFEYPADKKNPSRNRRIQNDHSAFGHPEGSQDDPFLDTALGIADESMTFPQAKRSSTKVLSVIGILVLMLVSIAVIFAVLALWRRHEVRRWREYRTHQVLRDQDEAFDMSYDETFDLELIEGELS